MIKSMTGYGKSVCRLSDKVVTIEIRSLNSKNMDLNLKIPSAFREKENVIRNILGASLERGKTECSIFLESLELQPGATINKDLLTSYFNDLRDLSTALDISVSEHLLPALLRLPDVLQSREDQLKTEEWEEIEKSLNEAIEQVNEFRLSEGRHLQTDIMERVSSIETLLELVDPFEKARIQLIRERINRSLKELGENTNIDQNRFEQELIFYLEKLDITEEKVRLKKHLQYFFETIENAEAGGKKLGFISQEIGREINTIGSKANDAGLQKIVVEMKDELEKIKEQLMNVL